jgi:phosphoribosylamine--glycine ligase
MENVLIIGSGGREHALAWSIAQDKGVEKVYVAPGNAGIGLEDKVENININAAKEENFEQLCFCISAHGIDSVVVGPEDPLAWGIVDQLKETGFDNVFGPTAKAAKLESDKFFSYVVMDELGIPQANSVMCEGYNKIADAIDNIDARAVVLKTRGLAAGKGVLVCDSKEQALENLVNHIETFGDVQLVAERLYGQEFSVFGIADGKNVRLLNLAVQDHKPLLDNDQGPNTGGMGAYCPAPIANEKDLKLVEEYMTKIVQKIGFSGFLYAGMIKTEEGPKVIEWNIRFGDPEAQPAMMMLKNGIYQPIKYALDGKLDQTDIQIKNGAACCVVLASDGYPGSYEKGIPITGIEKAESIMGVKVFHAGTAFNDEGKLVTSGGRVLGVTGYGDSISDAQKKAYHGAEDIGLEKGQFHYRKDIAQKAFR